MATKEMMGSRSNRLLISLVVLVLWTALVVGGQKIVFPNAGSLDDLVRTQINIIFVIAIVLLLIVIFAFKWQRRAGLKPADPPRSWCLLWFPALFIVLFLLGATLFGLPPTSVMLFVLINTLFVGVEEELMFRGIMFQGLLSSVTIWPAILLTSILFGSVHALNGFLTGDFIAALVQAVAAAMSGLWLMAVRLRTKSLYPTMLIHGLWDFAVFIFSQSAVAQNPMAADTSAQPFLAQFALSLLLPLPLFLYGLWLLRSIGKQSKEEVLA